MMNKVLFTSPTAQVSFYAGKLKESVVHCFDRIYRYFKFQRVNRAIRVTVVFQFFFFINADHKEELKRQRKSPNAFRYAWYALQIASRL